MKEIWKSFMGDVYFISNYGRVKSCRLMKSGKYKECILKSVKHREGYCQVTIYSGKPKIEYVHRLVAEKFVSNINNKPFVNHKNGIKTDNRADNLEWCTQKENIHHSLKNGFQILNGENNPSAKLTKNQVLEIVKIKKTSVEICKKYGVDKTTIQCIKNGKRWSSVTGITYIKKL